MAAPATARGTSASGANTASTEAHHGPPSSLVIHPSPEPAREPAPIIPGLPRDGRRWALEAVQAVLLAALAYVVVNAFIAQPFAVELRSMEPTLAPGDHLLVDKLSPRWDDFDRGQVVVFAAPPPFGEDGIPYVKRVIGLPGERIELRNGRIYLTEPASVPIRLDEPYLADAGPTMPLGPNGETAWVVPPEHYFVLGDNRGGSVDSRTFGPIARDRIVGRVWVRYLPVQRFGPLVVDGGR